MARKSSKKIMKHIGAILGIAVVAFILYRSIDISFERRSNADCGCGKKPPIEADAQPMPPQPPQPPSQPSANMSSLEPSEPGDELKDVEEN
ncbi:MAG TPA: hypothetical protein VHK67_05415 [Rhabdochlamydiaceae bacterium]|nr:hypothetical protein [Rhabdochlamydiaceae bacterium]